MYFSFVLRFALHSNLIKDPNTTADINIQYNLATMFLDEMVSGYYIWIHRSDIKSRGNSVLVSCLLRRTIWLSRIQCHIWGTVAGLDTSGEVHFQEVSSQHLCNEQQWCLTSASIGTSHRLSAATPTTIAAPSQYTFNVAAIGCCALALVLFD